MFQFRWYYLYTLPLISAIPPTISILLSHPTPILMESKPSTDAEIVTVDVHEAKALVDSGHRYLDVRTEEEFYRGRVDVENSLNIPYMVVTPQGRVKNPNFLEQVLSAFSKEDLIVVGCQSGVRSAYATSELVNAGLKNVCNMGGGYASWVNNGLAVKIPAE